MTKTLRVDRPFLDEDGVTTRLRGEKITVSDNRAKELQALRVVGGHHRREVPGFLVPATEARQRRRVESAIRVLQSAGLAPMDLTYEALVAAADKNDKPPIRTPPAPRRTQDKPDPARQPEPSTGQDDDDDEDDPSLAGTISEDGSTFTAADGTTRETTEEEKAAHLAPPAEKPADEPPAVATGRRQRGNRPPA